MGKQVRPRPLLHKMVKVRRSGDREEKELTQES